MKQKQIKEQILKLVTPMLDWYQLEIKGLQASLREVKKIVQKESSELTSSDWGDLQHEMKFLQERLGDEDNYEKLEELTNKLAK